MVWKREIRLTFGRERLTASLGRERFAASLGRERFASSYGREREAPPALSERETCDAASCESENTESYDSVHLRSRRDGTVHCHDSMYAAWI